MRLFGYPYNDLVICKDSPDYLGFSIEYSCHTIINIKHEWRLSLQLMTNWSLTSNYSNACLEHYHNLHVSFFIKDNILKCSCSWKFNCHERQFADNMHVAKISGTITFSKRENKYIFLTK